MWNELESILRDFIFIVFTAAVYVIYFWILWKVAVFIFS